MAEEIKQMTAFLDLQRTAAYVAGREHHATENVRFAARMKEENCEATVLAAEGKTHLRIELEIGLGDDVPTAAILKFFDQQMRKLKL